MNGSSWMACKLKSKLDRILKNSSYEDRISRDLDIRRPQILPGPRAPLNPNFVVVTVI